MKRILLLIILLSLSSSCSITKLKSYTIKKNNVKTVRLQSEFTQLKITPVTIVKSTTDSIEIFDLGSIATDQLSKIPGYLKSMIVDRKKKYYQKYEAKANVLTDKEKKIMTLIKSEDTQSVALPKLELTRYISSSKERLNRHSATIISLEPKLLDTTSFSFIVSDVEFDYSKAKITSKYPFVNLNIIVTCTYKEKKDNKPVVVVSEALTVPVTHNINFKGILGNFNFESDPFPLNDIQSIKVEVTEVNPYYLKLEEVEKNLSDNKDALSELLKKIAEKLE